MNTWELEKFTFDKNVWKLVDNESHFVSECRIEFKNQDSEFFSILIDKDTSKQIMELIVKQLATKADAINDKLKSSFDSFEEKKVERK